VRDRISETKTRCVKKVVKRFFICPKCGAKDISIRDMDKSIAIVKCSCCGIERKVSKVSISERVDVFGDFIDIIEAEKKKPKTKGMTYDELINNSGFLEF